MLGQLNLAAKNKVQVAIERYRMFEPPEGYYLAFSGGKDSLVIKALADMAGVKYDAHYSITTADPPELVQYIRKHHKDVAMDYPGISMWQLIPKKLMPPTRKLRYCCEALKERGGHGRVVITGVRWAESPRRRQNWAMAQPVITSQDAKTNKAQGHKIMFMNDNDERRRMTEQCLAKGKFNVNPILDWTDKDVWMFIRSNKLNYCKLYDQGFNRLGCIGCPYAKKNRHRDFKRWPKYKALYLRAFGRMLEERKNRGKETTWQNAEDVMDWWLGK